MQYKVLILSALAGLAAAVTPADTSKDPSGNPITAPLVQLVPAGKPFEITWTVTTPGKVSLLLLKGPSNNVVPIATIADSIDNSGSYSWTPSTDLDPTTAPGGYGIQLIVEGTGQYQYSTQFGISKADGTVSITSSASSASESFASVETAPPSGTTQGTAEGGALAPTDTETPLSTTPSPISIMQTSAAPSAAPIVTGTGGATGGAGGQGVAPTGGMSVPSSLSTVATPSGGAAASPSGGARTSTAISSGLAAGNTAQLSGVAAAFAGLLGFFLL